MLPFVCIIVCLVNKESRIFLKALSDTFSWGKKKPQLNSGFLGCIAIKTKKRRIYFPYILLRKQKDREFLNSWVLLIKEVGEEKSNANQTSIKRFAFTFATDHYVSSWKLRREKKRQQQQLLLVLLLLLTVMMLIMIMMI